MSSFAGDRLRSRDDGQGRPLARDVVDVDDPTRGFLGTVRSVEAGSYTIAHEDRVESGVPERSVFHVLDRDAWVVAFLEGRLLRAVVQRVRGDATYDVLFITGETRTLRRGNIRKRTYCAGRSELNRITTVLEGCVPKCRPACSSVDFTRQSTGQQK